MTGRTEGHVTPPHATSTPTVATELCPRSPQPSALSPQPSALRPHPYTLNPPPVTHNPEMHLQQHSARDNTSPPSNTTVGACGSPPPPPPPSVRYVTVERCGCTKIPAEMRISSSLSQCSCRLGRLCTHHSIPLIQGVGISGVGFRV